MNPLTKHHRLSSATRVLIVSALMGGLTLTATAGPGNPGPTPGQSNGHSGPGQPGAAQPSPRGGPQPGPAIVQPGHPVPRVPRGAVSIQFGGGNIFFYAGFFYRWTNGSYIVVNAPAGIVVPSLPSGCLMRDVGAQTYYVLNGTYYRAVPGGYAVVEEPAATTVTTTTVTASTTPSAQSTTVWIQNGNGSRTPVVMTPAGDGQWIGPKGEYYTTFPSETQLLPIYGLPSTTASASVESTPDQQIIWIDNTNGSKTPVELERQTNGTWQGPNGEIYQTLPTAAELRQAYGLTVTDDSAS